MDRTFWHKQTGDKPLYPDLLWSRPETKRSAGKLLIVGGNAHGFAAPAEAYNGSQRAGVGLTRVLLPLSVKRLLPKGLIEADFAPSTPSGSFSRQSLAELLEAAKWADGVLLAGDFGHNSETAILLEQFADKYAGQLTLTGDALDYFVKEPRKLLARTDNLLVLNFAQLQKLATGARLTPALTSDMDLLRLIEALHEFTGRRSVAIVVEHLQNVIVAVGGQVSTTKFAVKSPDSVAIAAHAAVWWLQNPAKPFEALSTAVIEAGQ